MLTINVSIPNLTVARLEQFYESRERERGPTDVGADCKQTIIYATSSCRYLPSESICSYFSPKIGCHGNVPLILDRGYVFIE